MSEYQYYEFRAIDRPLGPEEMAELRALSTRAAITPTSFTNSYQWGNFKEKPAALMDRYFDAFLYYANWGSRQFMLRLPRRFLDIETAAGYADEETLAIRTKGDHVVIEFSSENEDMDDEDWEEEGQWMASLISLRDELIRGDRRALYLGWLASFRARGFDAADDGEIEADDDFPEPPVPLGLAQLSAPLRTLAEFLRVDDELIQVAAAGSVGEPPDEPAAVDLARWVRELPAGDKDACLLRLLAEDGGGFAPSGSDEAVSRGHHAAAGRTRQGAADDSGTPRRPRRLGRGEGAQGHRASRQRARPPRPGEGHGPGQAPRRDEPPRIGHLA